MAATGLLQYYFFPTDFFYPRPPSSSSSTVINVDGSGTQQQVSVPLKTQKTEAVNDHPKRSSKAVVVVLPLRDVHANNSNNKKIASISSTTRKGTMEKQKQGRRYEYDDEEEEEGDFVVVGDSELTPLHLCCSVSVPDEFA